MKSILLLSLIFLVGCASSRPPAVRVIYRDTPAIPLSSKDAASVRLSETIKAYPLGRYVDPHNRRVMHEGHTVYRIESSPRWNLYTTPSAHIQSGPSIKAPRASAPSQAINDELRMEINRQRTITQTVIQSGQIITDKLKELTAQLEQLKASGKQNTELQKEVDSIKAQIIALEATLPTHPKEPETNW